MPEGRRPGPPGRPGLRPETIQPPQGPCCAIPGCRREEGVCPSMDARVPCTDRELARSWQGGLGRLELELKPHNFAAWLRGTRAVRMDERLVVVEAASEMACSWLNQRMKVVVERAAAQVFG